MNMLLRKRKKTHRKTKLGFFEVDELKPHNFNQAS